VLAAGRYEFGSDTGRLVLRTFRTGLGARAGHDLVIEVTSWQGSAQVDGPTSGSVQVSVEVDSFRVREGTGGVKPLTDSDRADILRTIREKILHTPRYPRIEFRSTRVGGDRESLDVEGELTIHGTTRPWSLRVQLNDGQVRAAGRVTQSWWGVKPYQAFLGALKLRDEVDVELTATLRPSAA
jgi:polyisoprenoid-binding protein YceI